MKRPLRFTLTVLGIGCLALIAGCGARPGGAGNGASPGAANTGDEEWLRRTFSEEGVSVQIPAGWSVSRSGVFSAYSSEGLAFVQMKPAQVPRGSKATTAAEHLAFAVETFTKFEIGQPVTQLNQGEMPLAGRTAAWVELSYQKPPTWLRMMCVVTDKPYIILCWARHDNSGERSENRRKPFDEYREQVLAIMQSIQSA